MKRETVFGILGVLLYTQPSVAQKSVTDTVRLNFNIDSVALEEVVVKGARTPAANSRWSDMHPVELVTVGGANGDLYKALQTLPGTQVQGETGELLVRGGGSYETQTFIDGMHVLNPYTSNGRNPSCPNKPCHTNPGSDNSSQQTRILCQKSLCPLHQHRQRKRSLRLYRPCCNLLFPMARLPKALLHILVKRLPKQGLPH